VTSTDLRAWAARLTIVPAALFLAFANGRHMWWPATWIGLFLMVRFLRSQPPVRGLGIAWIVHLAVWSFQWSGVFRMTPGEFLVTAVIMSSIGLTPYAADRLLGPRLPAWASTLVLPTALVAMEFMFFTVSPYGAWGSIAYSQTDLPPLAMLASVAGMWGVTFLVAWTASTANVAWEEITAGRRFLWPAAATAAVLGAALAFGASLRAGPAPAAGPAVAMVLPRLENNLNYELEYTDQLLDGLFADSALAAPGARFVVWPEDSFALLAADEPAFLDRARRFTAEHGVYLQASYGRREGPGTRRYANKTVLIAPSGRIVWDYRKTFPVPGYEARHMIPGKGPPPVAEIDGVRYAAAICYDGDHPQILRQVGPRADVLFLPSDDWPDIVDLHARMVQLRAIEYGVFIVRPTLNGRTAAFTRRGEVLGAIEPGAPQPKTATVRVEPSRSDTPYSRHGDWFAWACLGGLALLVLAGLLRPRRRPA
jgi:apolipoprotein N-acyltransferase